MVNPISVTPDVSLKKLEQAFISNPAGNGQEQTPLVLIRPLVVPNMPQT
ncbi:MAG TPA: hypothetical protein V6D11_08525 [Waterburya sp.]